MGMFDGGYTKKRIDDLESHLSRQQDISNMYRAQLGETAVKADIFRADLVKANERITEIEKDIIDLRDSFAVREQELLDRIAKLEEHIVDEQALHESAREDALDWQEKYNEFVDKQVSIVKCNDQEITVKHGDRIYLSSEGWIQ